MARLSKLQKLSRVIATPVYRRGLRHSVAAAVEHEPFLKKGNWRTIIDIGANRGQFALACRHCCPQARILSFEPLKNPASVFSELFAGDASVSLTQAAVGPERQTVAMHVSNRDDSSSLLPISRLQASTFPGTQEVSLEMIEVGPLHEFVDRSDLESPTLLKIDVQGYELQAVYGCAAFIELIAAAYIECSFVELYEGQSLADEVIVAMSNCGFGLAGMHNPYFDAEGATIQADFLFTKA